MQAEEIGAVLLRTYQDTRDPDQRPYPGPSPVSADLMGDAATLYIYYLETMDWSGNLTDAVQWAEIKIRAGVVFTPVVVIRAEKGVPAQVQKRQ